MQQGYAGHDLANCAPYTCVITPETTCQIAIDRGVEAEKTYQQDWVDCH